MTEQTFNLGWATLLNAFPNSKCTSETQQIYWEVLYKMPDQSFMDALRICLEECEFFPPIARLREAAYRKSYTTTALKQMQLDPPMSKKEATEALRRVIGSLPDSNRSTFKLLKGNFTSVTVPCIGCGVMCRLPFAEGGEKAVLCEECNNREKQVERKSK